MVVYAFIDAQNLILGVKSNGWLLDWKKFKVFLKNKYKVSVAYIFWGYKQDNRALYELLTSIGFILIFKPTIILKNGTIKGNVDAELVLHTIINIDSYTKAVLVSGDGDFFCLVDYLYDKDKFLQLVTPNGKFSTLYRKYNYIVTDISNLRNSLEYKKG